MSRGPETGEKPMTTKLIPLKDVPYVARNAERAARQAHTFALPTGRTFEFVGTFAAATAAAPDGWRHIATRRARRAAALQAAEFQIVVAPGCHSRPYFDPPVIGWLCSRAAAVAYCAVLTRMPDGTSHRRRACPQLAKSQAA